MAAPVEIKAVIENKALDFFRKEDINVKKISVVRKSECFTDGDIVIPSGCIGKLETKLLCKLREEIFEELKLSRQPVTKVCRDDINCVAVYLDRSFMFREIVSSVMKEKENYGFLKDKRAETVLLCNDNLLSNTVGSSVGGVSLERLRSFVIHDHVIHLLHSQGYDVYSPADKNATETYENLFSLFRTELSYYSDNSLSIEKQNATIEKLIESSYVRMSEQLERTTTTTTLDVGTASEVSEMTGNLDHAYEFDTEKFIQDRKLPVGKTGFDKNLSQCRAFSFSLASEILQNALYIYICLQEKKAQICVHINGQRQIYSRQKMHLILQELGVTNDRKFTQSHFVYGPVLERQGSTHKDPVNADDLFRIRYAELRQAAIMKYGEGVHGEGWAATLEALTVACIKFEMLSCVPRNSLKLDVCEDDSEGRGPATSTGSFVMYNCARLAALFRHFEREVECGTYPDLPPVEDVDFSTLREEAEWGLLFDYIYTFPDLVEQTIENLQGGDTIHTNIHTHKVCLMLSSLSRCLSSYYSRYHILRESRVQLMPTMYARLYLLKAVHQVMVNALSLLGIQPLSQL